MSPAFYHCPSCGLWISIFAVPFSSFFILVFFPSCCQKLLNKLTHTHAHAHAHAHPHMHAHTIVNTSGVYCYCCWCPSTILPEVTLCFHFDHLPYRLTPLIVLCTHYPQLQVIRTRNGFCHSPVDFGAYSHAYPRLLPLTPAHADAQMSAGEWQKPQK